MVAVSRDQNAPLLLVVADAGFRSEIRSVLSGISLGDRSCFWLAKVLSSGCRRTPEGFFLSFNGVGLWSRVQRRRFYRIACLPRFRGLAVVGVINFKRFSFNLRLLRTWIGDCSHFTKAHTKWFSTGRFSQRKDGAAIEMPTLRTLYVDTHNIKEWATLHRARE